MKFKFEGCVVIGLTKYLSECLEKKTEWVPLMI